MHRLIIIAIFYLLMFTSSVFAAEHFYPYPEVHKISPYAAYYVTSDSDGFWDTDGEFVWRHLHIILESDFKEYLEEYNDINSWSGLKWYGSGPVDIGLPDWE